VTDTKENSDVDVFEKTDSKIAEVDRDWIKLPRGDLLSIEEADELLRWKPAMVVAVIGERKSGKTTLITEIYERFLRGPFAGQLFSYSQTLLGFEKKSHPSRADSRADKPDTTRTSRQDGLRFFHLGLVSQTNQRRADLLITERAGEAYRDARDRPAETKTLLELAKARTVVFILDGERVVDDKTRAEAFASIRGMIRAFSDAGAIPAGAEVQLVTSKFDLLSGEGAADALTSLSEFEERLVKSHSGRFAKITHWRTAARDPKGQMEPAWGVPSVLQSWLDPPRPPQDTSPEIPELHDEFDLLLLRRDQSA
jgi:Double-GTPase 2